MPAFTGSPAAMGDLLAFLKQPPRSSAPLRSTGQPWQPRIDWKDIVAPAPQNWPSYNGQIGGNRYSALNQITPANVKNLKLQWVYQSPVAGNWQTTPLVVDGVMYLTQRLNDVVALDAITGRAFWTYRYTPAQDRIVCCGANNRGLAILGNTLFMGTLDAQLIALDARTGRPIWKAEVATPRVKPGGRREARSLAEAFIDGDLYVVRRLVD